MNEYAIVSIISILACLVLVVSGFRSHQLSWRKGFYMAAAWAGIFAIVILFIDAIA